MRESVWQPRRLPRQLLSLSAGEEYASILSSTVSTDQGTAAPSQPNLRRRDPPADVLTDLREKLSPFYSDIGRPSIDSELMLRMLIGG